jgi:heme exporter protein CcmD
MNVAHAGYIIAAYALCVGVIGGLVLAIYLDHRHLKRELARLGDRRGSDA